MQVREDVRYSSKIIKAGALLADTRLLLMHWDESTDVQQNLDRIRQENLFGKASRSRVADVLRIFQQRYLHDPELLAALITLARGSVPASVLDPILYFQAAISDLVLHDVVTDVLLPHARRGHDDVNKQEVLNWLRQQVDDGHTQGLWNEETTDRIAQGLLSTLRDFGVLRGAVNKRLAQIYLPTLAFSFIAFQLYRTQSSGESVLHSPEWRLFFLSDLAVERLFLEAHQAHLLEYYAAGRVVRIEFPALSIGEYARVLVERAP